MGDGRERGMPGGRAAQEEAFHTAQLQADRDGEEGVGDRPGQPLPAVLSLGTFRCVCPPSYVCLSSFLISAVLPLLTGRPAAPHLGSCCCSVNRRKVRCVGFLVYRGESSFSPRVRSISTPRKSCPRTFSWLACALPSAPPEHHAHTLSLSILVSPTCAAGALHFGNATNYATYLEAKKTSQDENATLAQQEEASAVVSTMEKEKTERLSARGAMFLSCSSPLMFLLMFMLLLLLLLPLVVVVIDVLLFFFLFCATCVCLFTSPSARNPAPPAAIPPGC